MRERSWQAFLVSCGLDGAGDSVITLEICDRRCRSAEAASRVFGTTNFSEFHFQGVINEQAIGQSFADAENFLDRFRCLKEAHGPG